jgi:hypothetical protein
MNECLHFVFLLHFIETRNLPWLIDVESYPLLPM